MPDGAGKEIVHTIRFAMATAIMVPILYVTLFEDFADFGRIQILGIIYICMVIRGCFYGLVCYIGLKRVEYHSRFRFLLTEMP